MKSEMGYKPKRATRDSAGYDFYAPYDIEIEPGKWVSIDTGISFEESDVAFFDGAINSDWCMLIIPRSGMGMRYGFRFRNTAALIDNDYRGRIMLTATADEPFTIKEGDRFCQGILMPFGKFWDECVPEEGREGGMGSTGQ